MTHFDHEERVSRRSEAAKFEAQKIAFAPLMFHAARLLRDSGILAALERSGRDGLTAEELAAEVAASRYAVLVLAEAGLGMDVIALRGGRFVLARTGWYLLNDPLTRVNMDFVGDVCYQGMARLETALAEGRPAGLEVFGEWETLYEALGSLPEPARASWLAFDHYYSDGAFPEAFEVVFERRPARLLDVGGNTGKWATHCVTHDPDVRVTIADLPAQVAMAERSLAASGCERRVDLHPIDLLDPSQGLPGGHDVVWMSQLLCCFSEEEIVSILRRARAALDAEGSRLFILDTYWDRQRYEMAAYCLQATSLYFAAFANGNSRMYRAEDMRAFLAEADLLIEDERDLAISHTLLRCRPS